MLHRYVLFVAVFALAVIVSGALITSTQVAARQSQSAVAAGIDQLLHRVLSITLTMLTLGIAIWLSSAARAGWLRALGWAAFATLVIDAATGWAAVPLSPWLGMLHASLAHLFFSVIVAIAIVTAPSWHRKTEPVDAGEWPLLRPLALATPPAALLQIVLGAAYRHEVTGVMPHMAGAMVVVLMTLVVSALVLQNFPEPVSMRRAAAALISIIVVQVCLGIAAFLMLVLNTAGTVAFVLVTVGHATTGALTLAASMVMAMQVGRGIRRKASAVGQVPDLPS
jgi:heme A synthase